MADTATTDKPKETKREHFKRLAEARVSAIITASDKLVKLANPHLYEYTEADVAKIREAIESATGRALSALENKGVVKTGFTLDDTDASENGKASE